MNALVTHSLFGLYGGLVGELIKRNYVITLPHRVSEKKFDFGFTGALIVGAFAGAVIDHHPAVAGLAGYAGANLLNMLLDKFFPELQSRKDTQSGETENQPREGA